MEDVHRRTAFLSDAHLGTPGCQAELRLDFLRHLHCRQLYLVGDIIDLGALQRPSGGRPATAMPNCNGWPGLQPD
ncbi:hypothetical protein [Frateuria aurantia]|uniref:Calcineurin-like phosphoesterase domain-containing protein n=1 Tax=Frateuria aurantia (strain ATCC 33424 / DSM 6220 / KCTC 2777 / LMG 1558 / NBRC 3245 / NCIMB 13370) TaxID=767434 RepID=H8KZ15_FRAAD|nr:hypothetical protein [Frateuria aurantia]AFC87045.1 hypothetical protein Fraau_2703 [Frateuria aurantia DSM 6220]